MPKKPSGDFDQYRYIEDWKKQNMKQISVSYKREFVTEFKEACSKLGVKQSDVIRQAMIETIERAKAEE